MFTEDLSAFMDVRQGFAVEMSWSGGTHVPGIFDNAYVLAGGEIEGTGPAFLCEAAAVPGVAHGQTLTVGAAVYTIIEIQPELTGALVLLRLRAA